MCFEFSTSGVARLADAAGADFVMFDMEHTGWGMDTMRQLLAAARGTGVTSLVRVPGAQRQFVSPVLDLGALGVMVPQMESADDARPSGRIRALPAGGTRGVGVYYPDAMPDGLAAALELANREQLLIAQIETAAGVEAAHEIAAVDGIDLLWIGHFDLTTSLGAPGEFGNPRHTAAVEQVFAAAAAAGKPVGRAGDERRRRPGAPGPGLPRTRLRRLDALHRRVAGGARRAALRAVPSSARDARPRAGARGPPVRRPRPRRCPPGRRRRRR